MTRRLYIRPQATIDVAEIFDFIAARDEPMAVRFVDSYTEALKKLRVSPTDGHRLHIPEAALARKFYYRRLPKFENYFLIYCFDESKVEVVRITHGSRDFGTLLGG